MRRWTALLASVLVAAAAAPASAHTAAGHMRPAAEAANHLPADFASLTDSEWTDWRIGGIGGGAPRTSHTPVVFVHGNNTDAATWYPVISQLKAEFGYSSGDLWALSYNGVGCTNDGGLLTRNNGPYAQDRARSIGCVVTGNGQNVADLAAFVAGVRRYTGSEKVMLVGHSLGVTVARRTMFEVPEVREAVAGFVGIAGSNHGTSFCPPGSETTVESCNEIAAGTEWLREMNQPDEAPGPTRWMTVYDGTGVGDPAFAGPTYAQSPRLEGAANCEYPGFYHNDLRVDPRIVRDYAAFLAAVEAGSAFTCPVPYAPAP
ncbi:MAG TPA: alpha/beta fold hydrolase [Actinomycetota bacterium]|nr:alpha/beta fold hydrolase [Actinomycetota bacterium]